MAARPFTAPEYPLCKDIQREKPNVSLTEEVLQTFAEQSYVVPLFEQSTFDYKHMKHSSLKTNKLLKCRWEGYINSMQGKTRTPFQFPKDTDNHFYNYLVRYNPKATTINRESNRLILKTGPGVDAYGQRPISNDMHLRKTKHGLASNTKTAAFKDKKYCPAFAQKSKKRASQ